MNTIVIHYKELALKGRNRPWFIRLLVRNLRTALKDLEVRSVRSMMGRIEIDLPAGASFEAIEDRLRQDQAIGDDDSRIGVVRAERFGRFRCPQRLRCQHRKAKSPRLAFAQPPSGFTLSESNMRFLATENDDPSLNWRTLKFPQDSGLRQSEIRSFEPSR